MAIGRPPDVEGDNSRDGAQHRLAAPWRSCASPTPDAQGRRRRRALHVRACRSRTDRRRASICAEPRRRARPPRSARAACRRRERAAALALHAPRAARRCCTRSRTSSSTRSTSRSTRSGASPACPTPSTATGCRSPREEALHFTLLRDHLRGTRPRLRRLRRARRPVGDDREDHGRRRRAHGAGAAHARSARPRRDAADAGQAAPRAGDARAVEILDIILRDEVGHVAIGNHWYRWLCERDGLDPIDAYAELAARYDAPRLRAPFNLEARRAAGFNEAELAQLDAR